MRIANRQGRAVLLNGDGTRAVDIERAGGGFSDPQAAYTHWLQFQRWGTAIDVDHHPEAEDVRPNDLDAPVPRPTQVFGVGLNYADHAAEAGLRVPEHPPVFTKFPSSLTAPQATVNLSGARVD